ncbi:MAG: ABC transporter ATP-binding protein [Candidatus Tectomicrobia bacterium]|uniref:ABC transporter ATP-binding protein n=1 Tax=Tectimicrobiota bacterium TaxID=2528274 RepID=A0A932GS24_UNCTE|nr:ABC transporter ATP-binding protein [Candidatus Tectomicrobia bacterium]
MAAVQLVLQAQDVHTYYGHSHVLQGVSLQILEGQIVALLGRNGVGKTTFVRSVIGFTPPLRGRISLFGRDVTRLSPERRARLGLGLIPQGRRVFRSLTVEENIEVAARGEGGTSLQDLMEIFPNLNERLRVRAGKLSGGEQQMVAIARGLRTTPRLLLMDEPSEGLAPLLVQKLTELIRQIRADGVSILLVEQNLPLALEVADFVYIMERGRVVYQGLPEQLARDLQAQSAFLGI